MRDEIRIGIAFGSMTFSNELRIKGSWRGIWFSIDESYRHRWDIVVGISCAILLPLNREYWHFSWGLLWWKGGVIFKGRWSPCCRVKWPSLWWGTGKGAAIGAKEARWCWRGWGANENPLKCWPYSWPSEKCVFNDYPQWVVMDNKGVTKSREHLLIVKFAKRYKTGSLRVLLRGSRGPSTVTLMALQ